MGQVLSRVLEQDFVRKRMYVQESFAKPKISVIIPVYNVEFYICECLDSLLKQTMKELEFICVDDSSSDRSYEILKEYAECDTRFVVFQQDHEGQGVARNKGIELAKGEYICFLDSDDKLESYALEELYNLAKEKDLEVIQFNFITFGKTIRKLKNSYVKKYLKDFKYNLSKYSTFNWKNLQNENLITSIDFHVWSRFYKTSFIKDNNLQFAPTINGEDHLFVIGMLFSANQIYFYDKALYWYRYRADSVVNTKSDKNFCVFENLKLAEAYLKEKKLLPELNSALSNYKVNKLFWHYNQIPDESLQKYIEEVKVYLNENEYEYFKKILKKTKYSLGELIFSLKNQKINGVQYKYLTILGLKIQLFSKKLKA